MISVNVNHRPLCRCGEFAKTDDDRFLDLRRAALRTRAELIRVREQVQQLQRLLTIERRAFRRS